MQGGILALHGTTVEGTRAARGEFEATNANTAHRATPYMYLGAAPLEALALALASSSWRRPRFWDGRARGLQVHTCTVMRENTRHTHVHTATHAVTP